MRRQTQTPSRDANAATRRQSQRLRARLAARLAALGAALSLAGCALATPFETAEGAAPAHQTGRATAIIAITEARLGDDAALRSAFWTNVERVEASLEGQPGFLGHSKRTKLLGDVVWTMTAWTDEDSLDAFVGGEVHQAAIAEAYAGLEGARFVRFEVERGAVPPDWDAALERLEAEGRGY
ncbi:MAG: antibiotic biosynthesis monooxygenase [Pseudomonadota bacterium]